MNEFLARKPGKVPIRALMLRLITMPSRPLSFSACMADEGKTVPLMLKREARFSDADLDGLFRQWTTTSSGGSRFSLKMGANYKTLFGQLPASSLMNARRPMANGRNRSANELSELAKAGEGSFAEARPRVKARIEHMEKLGSPPKGRHIPKTRFWVSFFPPGSR